MQCFLGKRRAQMFYTSSHVCIVVGGIGNESNDPLIDTLVYNTYQQLCHHQFVVRSVITSLSFQFVVFVRLISKYRLICYCIAFVCSTVYVTDPIGSHVRPYARAAPARPMPPADYDRILSNRL